MNGGTKGCPYVYRRSLLFALKTVTIVRNDNADISLPSTSISDKLWLLK
jgi:hypothetical protein